MTFKSFLGWLNSDEGVGPGPKKEEPVAWREKRKDNRVELDPGRELVVHLLNPVGAESAITLTARVRNVSIRGCSLIFKTSEERNKAKLGHTFVASLAVDDFPIPLNVKVVRVTGDLEIGLQFKPPFPRELDRLERFLEPRCLGRSLREIDPKVLQKGGRKGLRWFQGVNETSLFSWDDPVSHAITQQQLVFLNRVVEWREGTELRTGQVRQDTPALEEGVDWVKSELLDFDAKPDAGLVKQAQSLLESTQIDADVKKKFIEKLKS